MPLAIRRVPREAQEQVKETERRRRVDLRCAPLPLAGRTVVLVDDGLATGTTARAPCRRSSASTRHGSVSDGEVIALLDARCAGRIDTQDPCAAACHLCATAHRKNASCSEMTRAITSTHSSILARSVRPRSDEHVDRAASGEAPGCARIRVERRLRAWRRDASARNGCRARRCLLYGVRQCAINTGTVIDASRPRVAPPRMRSTQREWP